MKTIKLAFSDEEFEVGKLTFGQVEDIMPLVPGLAKRETAVSTMTDVMQLVLARAYPNVVVRDLPADFGGMQKAFSEIMTFSGLEMKVGAPGEAKARAKTPSGKSAKG